SPVPCATLERYLAVRDADAIRVSHAIDGLPQRMIDNPYLLRLEQAGRVQRLLLALQTAQQWRKHTGMGWTQMLGTAWQALRREDMSIAQTLMAANAPVLIQRAMVDGVPDEGVLPSGQAAAAIGRIEPVHELIERIVTEAEARIAVLATRAARTLPETA
ncbi:MAG: nitronate monooxygenase, partial [Noviherbaspirillum sp.]